MVNFDYVVPKSSGASSKEEEFGLPIFLLVGFLAPLLSIVSNVALIAQSSNPYTSHS